MDSSQETVESIIMRIDLDGDGKISFDEFRRFYFLLPAEMIKSSFKTWNRSAIDIGESVIIPEDKKPGTSVMTTLLAGGIAGAVSRTATAPLDRLKVVLQA